MSGNQYFQSETEPKIATSFSIISGLFLFLFVLTTFYSTKFHSLNFISNKVSVLKKIFFGQLIKQESSAKWFGLGLINGVLPCGFVYLALGVAILQVDIFNTVSFMALFGLGTIPAMLTITITSGFINSNMKKKLGHMAPYFASFVAILLIMRGIIPGIPYISPEENHSDNEMVKMECCIKK